AKARRIFAHLSAGTVVRSLPKRLSYLWRPADSPLPGRHHDLEHTLAKLQYALLVVLIAGGLIVRRRRLLSDWPLWITAAYLTLVHLVFHVEDRYTLPARPALFVYAAVAVTAAVAWLRQRATATPL